MTNHANDDADLAKRTERVIGRCGGGINELISERILGGKGKPAGDYARKLADRGRLEIRSRLLPGGRNWITLTAKSAAEHGFPKERAGLPGDNALSDAVARLAFCHLALDGKRRFPLEVKEAAKLLGKKLPNNVSHVLTDEFGDAVLLRLYRVTSSNASKSVATLTKYVDDSLAKWPDWVSNFDYGFALLCPTDANRRQTENAVRRAGLQHRARIAVYEAPNAEHLNAYLKRRKKSAQ